MKINSRAKGRTGERELINSLAPLVGLDLTRNLVQTREGGHDILGLPWALEVKRYRVAKPADKASWWEQALEQAGNCGLRPAVAYREDFRPWRVIVRGSDLTQKLGGDGVDFTLEMSLEAFAMIVREEL